MNDENLTSQSFFQSPPGRFIKYHATGNDFILVALEDLIPSLQEELTQLSHSVVQPFPNATLQQWFSYVQLLCRPHLGIGADGILVYSRQTARVSIFNADGSAAAFCANGTRCAFHAVNLHRHSRGPLIMHTAAGEYHARFDPNQTESVLLSYPADGFKLLKVPDLLEKNLMTYIGLSPTTPVPVHGPKIWWLNSGVPHLYLQIDSTLNQSAAINFWQQPDFTSWASRLRHHPALGVEGSNVSLWWYDREQQCSYLRTFERGVEGQTLSCGSAVMGLGFLQYHLRLTTSPFLTVYCPGGPLQVRFDAQNQMIEYGGPVTALFDGTLRTVALHPPQAHAL